MKKPEHPTPQQKMNPEKEELLVESYFTQPAPDHKMPEVGVIPRAAYNMVASEMELDGDPNKNLATFVTTWMEPEARLLIADSLHKNYIDHAEYPRTAEISKRCVRIIHDLFNGPEGQDSPGTACAGSSEAVMLGALSMKWNWTVSYTHLTLPTILRV